MILLANISTDTLPQIIGQFGVLGVLIWYLYYTTTKTLPELNKIHNEQLDKVVAVHDQSIKDITSKFTEALADERAARKEELEEIKQDLRHMGCHVHDAKNKT